MEHCFMDNCNPVYLHNVLLFNIWISETATVVDCQIRSARKRTAAINNI